MERATVVETHISVLFFFGDRVYKVRKPVTTPFLDFSTRQARLADCRAEVQLNRRLAPDVYLGVHDVVDEAGAPVDHLVVMRRLPADRRLATMVADPSFDEAHLVAVARQVAAFHSRASRGQAIDLAGSVEHLSMLWSTNLEETAEFTGRFLDGDLLARIGRQALGYLDGRHRLIAHRVTERRTVDGHGDLLADDIFCLDDGPRILDCLEFDPRFRWGDVLYDTTFLAMDLEHLGRLDLARRFLAAYREFAAETHPDSLEHWYIAYRALVRAKIACLRADSGQAGAAQEAAAFLVQAGRHLDEAEIHLVLVGGLPGSGKSTLAEGLADTLGWAVLRSDEVRKNLAGLDTTESAGAAPFEGVYTGAFTAEVYRERCCVERGWPWAGANQWCSTPPGSIPSYAMPPGRWPAPGMPTSTRSSAIWPSTRPPPGSSPGTLPGATPRTPHPRSSQPSLGDPTRPGPRPGESTPAHLPPTSSPAASTSSAQTTRTPQPGTERRAPHPGSPMGDAAEEGIEGTLLGQTPASAGCLPTCLSGSGQAQEQRGSMSRAALSTGQCSARLWHSASWCVLETWGAPWERLRAHRQALPTKCRPPVRLRTLRVQRLRVLRRQAPHRPSDRRPGHRRLPRHAEQSMHRSSSHIRPGDLRVAAAVL